MERVLGFEHPDTLAYTTKFAVGLSHQKRIEVAREIVKEAEERACKLLGADNQIAQEYSKLVKDVESGLP